MSRLIFFVLALVPFLGATTALAAPAFGPLPALESKTTALVLRIVEYQGNTNGKMVVEVRNDGSQDEMFAAKGLYFVPHGDPDVAPQRLGAAGPFLAQRKGKWETKKALLLAPATVARLELDVFCIDSHRPSPSSSTNFDLARSRLPSQLRQEIESGTEKVLQANKVHNARHANSDVQRHVWKARDKNWIKLQGERTNERNGRRNLNNHQQIRR